MRSIIGTLILILGNAYMALADVVMADTLRESGKIYVVVTVLVTIMAGIFIYIYLLEKRLSKIEKQLKEE